MYITSNEEEVEHQLIGAHDNVDFIGEGVENVSDSQTG